LDLLANHLKHGSCQLRFAENNLDPVSKQEEFHIKNNKKKKGFMLMKNPGG
jgi:hypothetical protein